MYFVRMRDCAHSVRFIIRGLPSSIHTLSVAIIYPFALLIAIIHSHSPIGVAKPLQPSLYSWAPPPCQVKATAASSPHLPAMSSTADSALVLVEGELGTAGAGAARRLAQADEKVGRRRVHRPRHHGLDQVRDRAEMAFRHVT